MSRLRPLDELPMDRVSVLERTLADTLRLLAHRPFPRRSLGAALVKRAQAILDGNPDSLDYLHDFTAPDSAFEVDE